MSIHGPPRLYFKPLKLLNFDFNADLDPAAKNNADPDPATLLVKTSVYLEDGCPNWWTESLIKTVPAPDQPKSCEVLK
jgi:hypothetical protein